LPPSGHAVLAQELQNAEANVANVAAALSLKSFPVVPHVVSTLKQADPYFVYGSIARLSRSQRVGVIYVLRDATKASHGRAIYLEQLLAPVAGRQREFAVTKITRKGVVSFTTVKLA
jgi:hypothetical protein